MKKIFEFGQEVTGYDVRVVNERAVRASAGILFLLAIIAFMNSWLIGNYQPTRLFVVAFLLDFSIRIFINPRYAPTLIIGEWIVRKQQPDYVGAPQKRFAWGIGFALALAMFYLLVLNQMVGPVNLLICLSCLTLLFYEAAFGICLGCKVYNLFNKNKAMHCPGNNCETSSTKLGINLLQLSVLVIYTLTLGATAKWVSHTATSTQQIEAMPTVASPIDPVEAERCKVPAFAIALGHEEKWKLHNNCK